MTSRTVTAAILALAACPAAAQMAAPARATLAAPTAERDGFVANGTMWACDGAVCTGPAGRGRFGDVATCRDLAHRAGVVATYRSPAGDLSPDDLTRCNSRAKGAR